MSAVHAFVVVGKRLVRVVVEAAASQNPGQVVTLTGTPVTVDPTKAVFYTVASVHHALDRMPSGMLTSAQRLSPPLELLIAPYTNHFFKPRTLAEQIFHMYGEERAVAANAMLETCVGFYYAEYAANALAVAQAAA